MLRVRLHSAGTSGRKGSKCSGNRRWRKARSAISGEWNTTATFKRSAIATKREDETLPFTAAAIVEMVTHASFTICKKIANDVKQQIGERRGKRGNKRSNTVEQKKRKKEKS